MKSKSLLISVAVAVMATLPAPSAQASELAKLGRLIVTGKRAPAPEPKPAVPALREAEPRAAKPESGTPRGFEAGGEPSLDDATVGAEPATTPRSSVDPSRGERVGKSTASSLVA